MLYKALSYTWQQVIGRLEDRTHILVNQFISDIDANVELSLTLELNGQSIECLPDLEVPNVYECSVQTDDIQFLDGYINVGTNVENLSIKDMEVYKKSGNLSTFSNTNANIKTWHKCCSGEIRMRST